MSGLPTPHVYRLAPSMAARLMGPALVLLAPYRVLRGLIMDRSTVPA